MKKKVVLTFFILIFTTVASFAGISAPEINGAALVARDKGYRLQKAGKLKEAEIYYKKAIKLDPKYASPYNDLGVIYEKRGELDKAERFYLKALQIKSDYPGVYSNLASLYEKKGDLKRALAYWERRASMGQPGSRMVQVAQSHIKKIKSMLIGKKAFERKHISEKSFTESFESAKKEETVDSSYLDTSGVIARMNVKPEEKEVLSKGGDEQLTKDDSFSKFLSEREKIIAESVKNATGSVSKREVVVKKAKDIRKKKERKKVKKLISSAKRAVYENRYQDALDSLYEAKAADSGKYDKVLDELIEDARSSSIDYELMKASVNSDLYKKAQLLDVENAWFPPVPEPEKITGYAEEFKGVNKSKDRLLLEEKAAKVIPSIDFTDARLKDVIEFLAVSNDINIVIDETVVPPNETVTIHLKNIPLKEALDIILRTKGLKYRFEENIIWITTEEKLLEEDLVVRVYDVQDLIGKVFDFPSTPFDFDNMSKSETVNN